MDVFNEYLKGKKFILYTDHKPLEKMGHLHIKTMNRLQSALLEHDFVIQYKKGEIMPADYLSRLPSANPDTIAEVTQCFDPFQPDLIELQRADVDLQRMNYFRIHGKGQPEVSKADAKYLQNLAIKLFQDAHNIVWIRIDDYKYPRTALYLPEKYRKMSLCEVHNHQFGSHNAALKTYIQISSSYYWPKLWTDILKHTKTCLRCQRRKKSTNKPPPLHPLPNPERPNIRIHADLFGPMLAAGANTNTSCASRTLSQSMPSSRLSRTRRQKLWPRPFSMNGFAKSASRRKFTLTAGRNLSTSCPMNFSYC
jgi:Integrase zinc binding domain